MKRQDLPNKVVSPQEQMLNTDHLKTGMRARAVKSAGVTLAAQGVKLVLQLGSITIMARLLQPSDFGLVAMVTVFTGLALQLTEGGLSMATIQRDQITHAQISNLFWINGALGAGLCLLGILLSPLIANFYDEPKLTLIMAAMSLTFLIGGLSVQHDALLRRQMRFKAISAIDLTSMAVGIVAGICSAVAGFQYWALVISAISTLAVKTIMRWFSARWRPSMMSRGSGVRPLLGFGANLTGANAIGYIAANMTPLAVGYIGGAQTAGLFNRANLLTSMPSTQLLPPVMNVLQPTLARIANEPERLAITIKSIIGKIAIATMFVTLTMAVLADWIVELFLGPGWDGVVPIFRMLAVFSLVEPIAGLLAVSLVAVGSAQALLRWKAITLIILTVSLGIGSYWGAYGVVAAYAISGIFIRLPGFLLFASRYLPVAFGDFLKALSAPAICAAGATIALWALRQSIQIQSSFMALAMLLIFAAVIYLSFCFVITSTRRELIEIVALIKLLVQKRVAQHD